MSSFGQIICWNVRSVMVSRDSVQEIVDALGLKMQLPKRSKAEYLKRALKQAMDEGLVRKVGESETKIGYAIVAEESNLVAETFSTVTKTVVVLDKKSGDVRFTGDSSFASRVYAALAHGEGGLISHEIGGLLKRVTVGRCDALSLRDTGGVYFIPQHKVAIIDELESRLQTLVAATGGSIRIQRYGVVTGIREAKDIATAYAEHAAAEIAILKQEAVALMADLVNAKPSTFVKRAARLRKLHAQITSYGALLRADFSAHLELCTKTTEYLTKLSELCAAKRLAQYQQK